MKELLLTDAEAQKLIKILKVVAQKHNKTLHNQTNGKIDISTNNKVFHIRETEHNYTLIRINLNNKFHKNANGEKIWGNRINIFSSEEYYQKGDETTHYKAHPLPYESIRNTDDFLTVLSDLLGFTNVSNPEKININIQEDLL